MFLSALIVPDYDALKEYADANRIQYNTIEELLSMKQIYELLEKEFDQFHKKLANFERVRNCNSVNHLLLKRRAYTFAKNKTQSG